MNVFPQTPKLTKVDKLRLDPRIANAKKCRKWLNTNPSNDDIKRAVLIEMRSGRDISSRPIANILIIALQRSERMAIWARITQEKGMWP